jgi:hypothetical protein
MVSDTYESIWGPYCLCQGKGKALACVVLCHVTTLSLSNTVAGGKTRVLSLTQ